MIFLYVNEDCDAKEGTHVDGEEEPVEECEFLLDFFLVILVELVSSEGGDARLYATSSKGYERKRTI